MEAYILFPVIILLLSSFIRMNIYKSFKASIYIGVGLIGFSMLFTFFLEFTGPLVETLAEIAGKEAVIIDVGWPVLASVIWSSGISYLILPVMIGMNILMLKIGKTDTLNIDIWNYWHMALVGVLVDHLSGNVLMTLLSMMMMAFLNLKLSDWSASIISHYYGLQGVAASNMNSLVFIPYAIFGNWIMERLPLVKSIGRKKDKEKQHTKLGVFFREPYAATIPVGIVMPVVAGYPVSETIAFSFKLTAVFMILPQIAGFIQDGFRILAEGMNHYVKNKRKINREIRIGVNHMILFRDPSLISVSVFLIPILLFMSFMFRSVPYFPLADLTNVIGVIVFVVAVSNGNMFRSILLSIPVLLVSMKLSALMAPYYTEIARKNNFFQGESMDQLITSSMNGGNPLSFLVLQLTGSDHSYWMIAFLLTVTMVIFGFGADRIRSKKRSVDSGYCRWKSGH